MTFSQNSIECINMTVLIALKTEDGIYIASDSQSTLSDKVHTDSCIKVHTSDNLIVASCGLTLACGFLHYVIKKIDPSEDEVEECMMEIIPDTLSKLSGWRVDNGYIVALYGRLWDVTLSMDDKTIEYNCMEFTATGSILTAGSGWFPAKTYIEDNIHRVNSAGPIPIIKEAIAYTAKHDVYCNSKGNIYRQYLKPEVVEVGKYTSFKIET